MAPYITALKSRVFRRLRIKNIGLIEGFDVVKSYAVYPARDSKIKTQSGKVLEAFSSKTSNTLDIAIKRCAERIKFQKKHAAVLSNNPTFKGNILGKVASAQLQGRASDGLHEDAKKARIYYEGGDVFHVNNQNNIPKFLIGEDLITITHQALRRDRWFVSYGESSVITESMIKEEEFFSKDQDPLNQMYISKEIPLKVQQIAEVIAKRLDGAQIDRIIQEMVAMGIINVQTLNEIPFEERKSLVSEYLAQLEFVEKQVFSLELETSPEHIHSLPQTAYHLDLMMTPGPKGSFFLQDFNLAVKVLKHIQANHQALHLTGKDLAYLEQMILETEQIGIELEPLMNTTRTQLKQAGFDVISTPGCFFSSRKNDHEVVLENINFLNCLSGYSKKTERFYMIVPGTNLGDRLADVIMDCYVEFLHTQCETLAVYFVGSDPLNLHDFYEAVADLNKEKLQLGPHCLSYELKTESYTCEE